MRRVYRWISAATICVVATVGIAVCIMVFLGAPFALADIDYDEMQQQAAGSRALVLQVFCVLGVCAFTTLMLISGQISEIILKIFGGDRSS